MKKFAIVAAAGSGTRMGYHIPKQFMEINGKPLLFYTLNTFLDAYPDIHIILVIHPGYFDKAKNLIQSLNKPQETIHLIPGAASRFGSVKAGLELIDEEAIVFVHDGVRCLLSTELIQRCYQTALDKGNAIPAITAVDSVRIIKDDQNQTADRKNIRLVQTPQTFRASILKQAYKNAAGENFTDDAAVVENDGVKIHLVEGETTNIKITLPLDLLIAGIILKNR